MQIIKIILMLCVIIIMVVGGSLYGYKLGVDDSASLIYFSELGLDYAHLKILKEKGAEKLGEFIEEDLDYVFTVYKGATEEETIFSKIFGPEKIRNTNREYYLTYYRGILEYKKMNPSKDKESKLFLELEQFINHLEKK